MEEPRQPSEREWLLMVITILIILTTMFGLGYYTGRESCKRPSLQAVTTER